MEYFEARQAELQEVPVPQVERNALEETFYEMDVEFAWKTPNMILVHANERTKAVLAIKNMKEVCV